MIPKLLQKLQAIAKHGLTPLVNLVLLCLLVTATSAQAVPVYTGKWLTVVSLNFDDGLTQSPVRDILVKHNMIGTFYTNSNLIGSGGTYLTKAELDAIAADGNEIAGHTINHVDLATLSDADQKTAICTDMLNLVNWGYPIYSFAYPYSSTGPTTQSIVAAGCPGVGKYESARAVGGLKMPTECTDCPWAESMPPRNPLYIASIPSITSTTTLADLQAYVTNAETYGGGWVPLVFHRVCDGCSTLAVSPTTLDAFLTWLQPRQSANTYIKTMHQVMTKDVPTPPPAPQFGPNLIKNPSLETDADKNNQADCWQQDSYGVSNIVWTRSANAHTGKFAQQLQITGYSTGDAKLLSTFDAGQALAGCAPTVTPGGNYQLSAWYQSNTQVTPLVFYLNSTGVWTYWRAGPTLPATAQWTRTVFYPGAIPAGTQAISFGLSLQGNGTLLTDDYSITQVLNTPPATDITPPVISAIAPANGSVVNTKVALTASATDNIGVQSIEFMINGTVVATDYNKPYSVLWNSATVPNGAVSYSVRATDYAGNKSVSSIRQLVVKNDVTPPTVSLLQPPTPVNGATVSGSVALAATAADDVAVAKVDFLVNGTVVGSAATAPYLISWNSLLIPDGPATIAAMAYDATGNSKVTPAISVTVSNSAGNLLTNPSLEIDANSDGIADCWQRAGYGTNTYVWSRVSGNAHSGNFSESVQITSVTSGDRKLVQRQDLSNCAPAATPGKQYKLSGWYNSNTDIQLVAYYRDSAGAWQYWLTSASFPLSSTWAQATYTTPALPAGATAISFGLTLTKVGTLVTDDYGMTLVP